MFILSLLAVHSLLACFGVPYGWWVAREAKRDKEFRGNDGDCTEADRVTAELRRRNTWGIYFCHVCYLAGAIASWALVIAYVTDVIEPRWAFALMVLVGSVRSIVVQSLLLWLSVKSREDRLTLMEMS